MMTAREQLAKAAEEYQHADWAAWSCRNKSGDFPITNYARRKAYEAWIEAVIRFQREQFRRQEAA